MEFSVWKITVNIFLISVDGNNFLHWSIITISIFNLNFGYIKLKDFCSLKNENKLLSEYFYNTCKKENNVQDSIYEHIYTWAYAHPYAHYPTNQLTKVNNIIEIRAKSNLN
jgi:hypothetical protein